MHGHTSSRQENTGGCDDGCGYPERSKRRFTTTERTNCRRDDGTTREYAAKLEICKEVHLNIAENHVQVGKKKENGAVGRGHGVASSARERVCPYPRSRWLSWLG